TRRNRSGRAKPYGKTTWESPTHLRAGACRRPQTASTRPPRQSVRGASRPCLPCSVKTATQTLHRLTSYQPGRDWDEAIDDPRIVQDLEANDMSRFPLF